MRGPYGCVTVSGASVFPRDADLQCFFAATHFELAFAAFGELAAEQTSERLGVLDSLAVEGGNHIAVLHRGSLRDANGRSTDNGGVVDQRRCLDHSSNKDDAPVNDSSRFEIAVA